MYQSNLRRVQVLWDSGLSVDLYYNRMAQDGAWGGAIEMAAFSHLKSVKVHVYQAMYGDQARAPLHTAPT